MHQLHLVRPMQHLKTNLLYLFEYLLFLYFTVENECFNEPSDTQVNEAYDDYQVNEAYDDYIKQSAY